MSRKDGSVDLGSHSTPHKIPTPKKQFSDMLQRYRLLWEPSTARSSADQKKRSLIFINHEQTTTSKIKTGLWLGLALGGIGEDVSFFGDYWDMAGNGWLWGLRLQLVGTWKPIIYIILDSTCHLQADAT
jgi:hypothetical protein